MSRPVTCFTDSSRWSLELVTGLTGVQSLFKLICYVDVRPSRYFGFTTILLPCRHGTNFVVQHSNQLILLKAMASISHKVMVSVHEMLTTASDFDLKLPPWKTMAGAALLVTWYANDETIVQLFLGKGSEWHQMIKWNRLLTTQCNHRSCRTRWNGKSVKAGEKCDYHSPVGNYSNCVGWNGHQWANWTS